MEIYGGMSYQRVTAFTRYGYCVVNPGCGMPGAFPFGILEKTEVRVGDLIAIGTYEGCTQEVAKTLNTIEARCFTGKFYRHALGVLVS